MFDRSGPYSSGPFDIHDEPDKFIQAFVGYTLMSNEGLGLVNLIEETEQGRFITVTEDATGSEARIQLEEEPMAVRRAIVCRGTTCFNTKDLKQVVKLLWQSDLRPLEADHLRRARDHGVKGVARLFGHGRIASVKELRDGLTFPDLHRFRSASCNGLDSFSGSQSQATFSRSVSALRSSDIYRRKRRPMDEGTRSSKRLRSNSQPSKLRAEYEASHNREEAANQLVVQNGPYKNRLLSYLVISPAGRPIKEFSSVKELLTALCDAIKAHQSLLTKAEILQSFPKPAYP